MSQHYFCAVNNNKLLNLLIGWDRPLHGFFLVVTQFNATTDQPLWCNLDYEPPHPQQLTAFLQVLSDQFQVALPPLMIDELENDAYANVGNKWVYHAIINNAYQRCPLAGEGAKKTIILPGGTLITARELMSSRYQTPEPN